MIWGIGIALHAFSVVGINSILGANWEELKIEELINEEHIKNKIE